MIRDAATVLSISLGCLFFLAGAVGMVRFPDVYSRLHALTKADNLGLGFVVLGLALQARDWLTVFKLVVAWLIALAASVTASNIVGKAAVDAGVPVAGERE